MRPTFLGFEAARSGLVASQKALDITGNNVANIHTEGYTRQRVDLVSMAFSGSANRYSTGTTLAGQGVYIAGVSQCRDPILDARYREQSTYVGSLETQNTAYTDLENLFDDVTSSGLQDGMSKLLAQLQSVSGNSDKAEVANNVLTAAKNVVQLINSYNSKLDQLEARNKTGLDSCVNDVNSILQKLGALNSQIKDACLANSTTDPITGDRRILGPYGPNELLDDRNLLLDQLSAYGEVDVKSENDGTITVTFGGTVAVKDSRYETLNQVKDAAGKDILQWGTSMKTFSSDSGAITAYIDVIAGKGGYASGGENHYEGIAYYREILNSFTDTFAKQFNNANNVTTPPAPRDLFSISDGATNFTAGNIRISDNWMNDPSYLVISVDGDKLANGNTLKMIKMFDDSFDFGSSSYTEFKGTFKGYLIHFQGKLGNQQKYISGIKDSTSSVAMDLLDQRDQISAVSENEEAINMMKYQKSYNAAARVITAMDECLDVIINKMGRVGL
ncbi:flagellar hook-associated protein FlgK [Acetanaerobacterium elongatum]|uniref:Flagellar hook-associated protein 1 n=1 Tax=Acetanaerobacterium elongatum TaxID=258515 RepID=A0A1G9ZHJ2_9FIRM|nr:flagellar hook-associated protein FlgK [Acetanaerobacterium elongatum]SDN20744.1 flagellar hook-associated protein 1 FlgK [Acetanaerobacterium elongatum]